MKDSNANRSRRRLLQQGALMLGGILAVPLFAAEDKPGIPQGLKKRPKETVGYRDFPYENRQCANCMLYVGNGECALIEGFVKPEGWCTQWIPPTFG